MKILFLLLVFSVTACGAKEVKKEQAATLGSPSRPPSVLQNIYVHVGKERVPNTVHWIGELSVFDNDRTCELVYHWKKDELKLKEKKCEKKK